MGKNDSNYRRGNKTRLRLNASRIKRKTFPLKRKDVDEDIGEIEQQVLSLDGGEKSRTFESKSHTIVSEDLTLDEVMGSEIEERREMIGEERSHRSEKMNFVLEGRRIVNINFFLKSLFELNNHCPKFNCSLNNLRLIKEEMTGFISTLVFHCNMCNRTLKIHSCDDNNDDVNKDAVLGIMTIGSGFSHLEQISSSLDLPCMSARMYNAVHNEISDAWEQKCLESMREAAEEERALAIAAGDVDQDGTPMITVVADGCWAKRSYRSKYDSLSGAATIMGYRGKKVLFLGVRNKFCTICKLAEKADLPTKDHKCYKNWTGSSSSMEADILAEGFLKSKEMYNLIYHQVIADGDSNCYKKILDSNPYDTVVVKKIECKNHLMRNYYKKLRELCKDTTAGPLNLRQEIQKNHLRLGWAISKAITFRKDEEVPLSEKINRLKGDIDNSLSHVFGEHKDCQKIGYFCEESYVPNGCVMSSIKGTNLYAKLLTYKNHLIRHASSLIYDVNNNIVEQLNSIIAKFVGGKRVNFCKKRSYKSRCAAAVVSHNTKRPIYTMKKHLGCGVSPGKFAKKIEIRNKEKNAKRKSPAVRRYLKYNISGEKPKSGDKYYGENCEKPDMLPGEFSLEKTAFLKRLHKSESEIKEIEFTTRGQQQCEVWYLERRKRLTASRFGDICRMRETTSCRVIVESIIYPKQFTSASCEHGKQSEEVAKKKLQEIIGKQIQPCGFFIDSEFPFLGASPDGLIEERGIVEIKCPWSARELTPEEGIAKKKITFWVNNQVNTSHKWYYQIQGQLHVTKRSYCIFAVWTPQGVKTETIFRDDFFWKTQMELQLVSFYKNCLLPELVDPRKTRNMHIRDPDYIKQAIEDKKKKEEKGNVNVDHLQI